jgi:hypothetical protein
MQIKCSQNLPFYTVKAMENIKEPQITTDIYIYINTEGIYYFISACIKTVIAAITHIDLLVKIQECMES